MFFMFFGVDIWEIKCTDCMLTWRRGLIFLVMQIHFMNSISMIWYLRKWPWEMRGHSLFSGEFEVHVLNKHLEFVSLFKKTLGLCRQWYVTLSWKLNLILNLSPRWVQILNHILEKWVPYWAIIYQGSNSVVFNVAQKYMCR